MASQPCFLFHGGLTSRFCFRERPYRCPCSFRGIDNQLSPQAVGNLREAFPFQFLCQGQHLLAELRIYSCTLPCRYADVLHRHFTLPLLAGTLPNAVRQFPYPVTAFGDRRLCRGLSRHNAILLPHDGRPAQTAGKPVWLSISARDSTALVTMLLPPVRSRS